MELPLQSAPALDALDKAPQARSVQPRYLALDAYRGFIMLRPRIGRFRAGRAGQTPPGISRGRQPIRAHAVGVDCVLGPDPAGIHVHGGRRHALRAGPAHGVGGHPAPTFLARRGAQPPADPGEPNSDLDFGRKAAVSDDQRPGADRHHLFPVLLDHATPIPLAGCRRGSAARRSLGPVRGVSRNRRPVPV